MGIEKTLNSSGERLKRARLLAGINTRREFEAKYHISANTLQGWEQNKNPLSAKGANRVVQALKTEGLICSTEWLLHGQGMPPRPFEMLNAGVREDLHENLSIVELNLQEEEAIYAETQQFKKRTPNAIVLTLADDAMEPYYSLGDHLGGSKIADTEIKQYIGTACIIELENNMILPRFLHKGTIEGTYTLTGSNPKTKAMTLSMQNVKILSAAPILWHRRKLTSLK